MEFENSKIPKIVINNNIKTENDILNAKKLILKAKGFYHTIIFIAFICICTGYYCLLMYVERVTFFGFENANVIYLTYFFVFLIVSVYIIFFSPYYNKKRIINNFKNNKFEKLENNYYFYKEYIMVENEKIYSKYPRTYFDFVCSNSNYFVFLSYGEIKEIICIQQINKKQKQELESYLEYIYAKKYKKIK